MMAWLAHLYTALGAATALVATLAVFEGRFRHAFLWLTVAVVIDATDGVLARAARVKQRLPSIDGASLDNVVDYLTYVFVPVLIMVRAGLWPENVSVWLGVAVLVASGYGFSRTDAKGSDGEHYFLGFPSYWNIVAVYLSAWELAPLWNAVIVAVFVALVFVPIRYVYPSRTRAAQALTLGLGVVWAVCFCVVIWQLPNPDAPWLWLSGVFPIYYLGLSLWLTMRPQVSTA